MVNNDWLQISQQLHDELNEIKRDALVPYVISTEAEIENERDLYEKLLIDVEMGSCGTTSKLGEAIAATQLYFHRYFVNLEAVDFGNQDEDEIDPEAIKQELKHYWQWMKNYRVWEANRKVFLYPENYIRPELRDTKTPSFKTLEEDLLQGEITEAAAQRVYNKYLEEYTEVSRLTIAGGYVYDSVDLGSKAAKSLVLFGRTKTDPRRYYYRLAKFLGGEKGSTSWDPWLKVNVQIDADKVYPVFAFNRVFVFWTKLETVTDTLNSTSLTTKETPQKDGNSQTVVSNSQPATHVLKIYYSFYNLNKEWVSAQMLNAEIKIQQNVEITSNQVSSIFQLQLENIRLLVETSDKLNIQDAQESEHENIIVNCTYEVVAKVLQTGGLTIDIKEQSRIFSRTFSLTPELYTLEIPDKPQFENTGKAVFKEIFNEPEISDDQVVMLNTTQQSSEGPWFSFDYKGGSFLCKPDVAFLEEDAWPKKLQGNRDGLPQWLQIDAAVQLPTGKTFFFRNDQQKYTAATALPQSTLSEEKDTRTDWGKVNNIIDRTGIVDAAYVDRVSKKTYLFSGNQYFVYSHEPKSNDTGFTTPKLPSFWELTRQSFSGWGSSLPGSSLPSIPSTPSEYEWVDEGYPKLIATNAENLPQVDQVDAVFQGKDGKTYFFNNTTQKYYVVSGTAIEEKNIRDDWGRIQPSSFVTQIQTSPPADDQNAPSIDAGFVYDNQTYLINRNGFIKYRSSDYQVMEEGYPKPNTLFDILNDMGHTPSDDAEKNQLQKEVVLASYDQGKTVYFTVKVGQTKQVKNYEYKAKKLALLKSEKGLTAGFAIGDVVYQFFGNQLKVSDAGTETEIPLNLNVNAAFVGTDKQIYIFRKADYISFPKARITTQAIIDNINNWSNGQPNESKWGKVGNNIARTGAIDAAFFDGEKTYLFSGDEYLVYSGDSYAVPDEGYPKKINANNENLPKWNKIDAVLQTLTEDGGKGTTYFFDNTDQTFVQSGKLGRKKPTKSTWGRVRNNIAQQGRVDSAFVKDGYLFLTSGDQIFRYTLLATGQQTSATIDLTLDEFIDIGYPKQFNWEGNKIDAAFNLVNKTYLFSKNGYYSRLTTLEELEKPLLFKSIQGNWGNLPKDLKSGFDAALDTPHDLFLFKGDRYIKYPNITNETSAKPFEIGDITYEIVRLTTSTAYRLNQKLFAGGLPDLLSLSTQEIDDTPSFSIETNIPPESVATTIKVKQEKVNSDNLPSSSHLDFFSANGIYYWEIFFHAPFLVAQALNLGQKFEEAKAWYEYIYDPTGVSNYWKFLPFLAVDIQAIVGSSRVALAQIKDGGIDVSDIETDLNTLLSALEPFADAFQSHRKLAAAEEAYLAAPFLTTTLKTTRQILKPNLENENLSDRTQKSAAQLYELTGVIEKLDSRYKFLSTNDAQLEAYLNDPFDPHAIAALRPIAYRKAIVMAYIDNLIDWGDMLFQQYTRESINEARMLYILAYDLLGKKPESLGTQALSPTKKYSDLSDASDDYDFLISSTAGEPIEVIPGTPVASVANPYFFIPSNPQFADYWTRVEDRLYKIRHCLNIMGISQPLPLFEPPIDPMALVQAVSTGASLSSALASLNIPVPHYRFSFMVRKAQDLVQTLNQFGNDLLSALEKKDAEELNLLQNRQEGVILAMTRSIKEAQLKEAEHSKKALQESLAGATYQAAHYEKLLAEGLTDTESAQIAMMILGSALMTGAGVVKIAGAIVYGVPQFTVGPFSFGSTSGGQNWGESLSKISEALECSGDGLSMVGEALGIYAQHERSLQDWTLQKAMADSEIKQINAQIEAAILQEKMAQREIEILEQQIAHNDSITTYMKEKFSNAQLYQWMASKLSGLYFQTYQMAFDLAKAAEKAFQFEHGMKESEVNFIGGLYWDSQRKGLLAGNSLGLDLTRMEKAYIESDRRGFEISKNISLLDLDPVALLQLKNKGVCEFSLPESLFDYDFPGHYCRQIKTISLTFDAGEGQTVMATLTQLNHKTVLEPDPKAVKYLLDPKDQPPLSIRHNWKANQQIALSYVDQYEKNNGLFELRFDDDRYLPFEGTGAVSNWRLELNGKKGSYNINDLLDITINLKYTAEQGGEAFAKAVKGLLKPYQTVRFFDMQYDFPDQWKEFLDGDSNDLILPFSRDLFPNMGSSKISGIFTKYDLYKPGVVKMKLNYQDSLTLNDGKYLITNGLTIGSRGSDWVLTLTGDKTNLQNVNLVVGYQATV